MEWNPCDVQAYYETTRKHNVLAVLYGHTHVRNILHWNGTQQKAEQGIPLLNIDNSSHFSGGNQAFFYIEIDSNELRVRDQGFLGNSLLDAESLAIPSSRTKSLKNDRL
jgi:hypothetical protein